jgi:hypothetical protein
MLSKGNEVNLEDWFERTKVPLNDAIWRIFG